MAKARWNGGGVAVVVSLSVSPASAQLDPLLFIKNVPARVIVVLDSSFRMLQDGSGNYYDPLTHNVAADAGFKWSSQHVLMGVRVAVR